MNENVLKTPVATYTTIDGNTSSVMGYIVGQGAQGVYIQGGMHGGEITYWIFQRLYDELVKRNLKKQVVLVPLCNPYSWQQRAYFYTTGKFSSIDGKDWLWSFPGDKDGSPMQRLAQQLYKTASSYELSIDLHTSRKSVPFGIFSSEKYQPEIDVLGIPYNFISTYGDSPDQYQKGVASLSYAMTQEGKRGFTLECGSHDEYNATHIELICTSVLNLLRHEGVIDEPVIQNSGTLIFKDESFFRYTCPLTGFVQYLKQPGDSYAKNDNLFSVADATNITNTVFVQANEGGTVLKISPTHIAQAGDVLMEIIKN
ncbi:MAG: succinylglutamate desuccinylase/aspartoacylase family protein [Candidatus Woesebacteria bacterium]